MKARVGEIDICATTTEHFKIITVERIGLLENVVERTVLESFPGRVVLSETQW